MPLLLKKLTRPFFQYRLPVSGKVAIGRDKNKNDLIIDEPSVSRIHCELEIASNNQITLTDLGSSIGTQVGDKKLEKNKAVQVSVGDHLRFGIAEFTLVDVPIVICISGLSGTEKEKVSRLAKQIGIKMKNELDASVTHVIIMPNGWTVTSKLLLGLLSQKEVVTPAWIVAMHDNPLLGIPDCDKYRPGPLSERHLTELGTVISMTQSQAVNGEATAGGVQPDFHIRKDRLKLFTGIPTFIIPAFAEARVSDEKELLRRGGARKFILSTDPELSSLMTTNEDQPHQAVLVCPSPVASFRQSNPSLAYLPAVDKSHIVLSVLLGVKLAPFPPEEGAKAPSSGNQSRMSPVATDRSFRLPPMSSSRVSKKETSPVAASGGVQPQKTVAAEKAVEDNKSTKEVSPVSMKEKENKKQEKKAIVLGGNQLEVDLPFNNNNNSNNAKPSKVLSPTNASSSNTNTSFADKFSTPQHSSFSVESPLPPLPVGSSVASSSAVSSKQSESETAMVAPQSSGPRVRMDFDVKGLVHERPPPPLTLNHPVPSKQKMSSSPVKRVPLLAEQKSGAKPLAGANAKLPMSLIKPQQQQQHQKKKKETFDLPAGDGEDDLEERIFPLGGYEKHTVGGGFGSEKQEYIPPKDLGWLEKPHVEGSIRTTTSNNTMSDGAMVEVQSEQQLGPSSKQPSQVAEGIIGAPIVETEDLVVRRLDDEWLHQTSTSSSASSNRNSQVVVDQKKFRKNKIIPSRTSRVTHKEVEVKVEASMAEQVRENNLKNEEQKILQAFGEFFQGNGDGKKRGIIQPTMKDFTTTTTTTARKRAANKKTTTANAKSKKKKRGYESESSSSLEISTSEEDFDVEDDEEELDEVEELLTDDDEAEAPVNNNNKKKTDDSIEILEDEDEADFNAKSTSKRTKPEQSTAKRTRLVDDKPPIVQAMTSSLKQQQQLSQKKNVKTVESVSTGASASPNAMTSKRKPAPTSLNLKAKKRT